MGPDSLFLLPHTLEEATDTAGRRARENEFITGQTEMRGVTFFTKVPTHAFVSSVPIADGIYRLVGKDGTELLPGVPSVDITKEDLFRFTNFQDTNSEDSVQDAITFLDFASSVDSLFVYVCYQPYKVGDPNQGDFKGVPLVDSEKFLKCVEYAALGRLTSGAEATPPNVVFPFGTRFAELSEDPILTLWTQPVSNPEVGIVVNRETVGKFDDSQPHPSPPPCPDFALMSEGFYVKRGYSLTIGESQMPEIVRLIFNAMGNQTYTKSSLERVDYRARAMKRKAMEELAME
jgi:hypothetical protein